MRFGAATQSVETVVQSNLDAAYRLARWHFGTGHEAEDAVHEAALRAYRGAATLSAGTGRVWFLRIVSHVCDEWRRRNPDPGSDPPGDEPEDCLSTGWDARDLRQAIDLPAIEEAIRSLPARLREVLVLRELEGLSYRELADVTGMPVETVTANLLRSRRRLGRALACQSVAV